MYYELTKPDGFSTIAYRREKVERQIPKPHFCERLSPDILIGFCRSLSFIVNPACLFIVDFNILIVLVARIPK